MNILDCFEGWHLHVSPSFPLAAGGYWSALRRAQGVGYIRALAPLARSLSSDPIGRRWV